MLKEGSVKDIYYYYNIFGLSVASEIILPEAPELSEIFETDVNIFCGRIDFDLLSHPETQNPGGVWHYCIPEKKRLYFRCEGISFAVTDGRSIVVDTSESKSTAAKLNVFLLGTAMGGIHMQRGNIPIHGAAIEGECGVTIITGFSGAGKSAVLGALTQDGYRYLADDVSVVSLASGQPLIMPAYPQRKIAVEDARALGYDTVALDVLNEDGRDKFVIRRTEEWCQKPLPLKKLVELIPVSREDGGEVLPEIRPVAGHAALGLVMRNLYRSYIHTKMGIEPTQMKKILEITSGIQTIQMLRPFKGFPVAETARMIAGSSLHIE